MSQIHIDVAVIGNELCGIAAAAQLAHRGLRVVLIDDGHTDVHPLGGVTLPLAPSVWSIPSTGMNADLIAELGLKHDVAQTLSDKTELGVISDPHFRCSFPQVSKEREVEFSRIFGKENGRMAAEYLSQYVQPNRQTLFEESALLMEKGLFTQFKAKKRIQNADDEADPLKESPETTGLSSSPLRPFLESWAAFELPIVGQQGHGFMFEAVAQRFKSGATNESTDGLTPRNKLRQLFMKVVAGHGGDIIQSAQIVDIETRGSKVLCLQTNGQNNYVAKAIIDATPDSSILDHFPESRALTKTRGLEKAILPQGVSAIRRWLIPRSRLPRGLGYCTLLHSEDPETMESPILLSVYRHLQWSDPERRKGQDKQSPQDPLVGIVAAARSPKKEEGSTLSEYIVQTVGGIMPFSLSHAVAADEITGQRAWNLLPSFAPEDGAHVLLRGRSPRTGFQNLFRAGRDIAPAMGLEGELSASRSISESISSKLLTAR